MDTLFEGNYDVIPQQDSNYDMPDLSEEREPIIDIDDIETSNSVGLNSTDGTDGTENDNVDVNRLLDMMLEEVKSVIGLAGLKWRFFYDDKRSMYEHCISEL